MRTHGKLKASKWLAVAAAALAALALPVTAQATFPGSNGEIVYGWSGVGQYRGAPAPTSIRAVDPRSRRVRVLRDCPRTEAGGGHPECSVSGPRYAPDGRRIVFFTTRRAYPDRPHFSAISIMASNGTGLQDHATQNHYYGLAWSPAGDQFIAQRDVVSCCDPGGLPVFHGTAIFLTSLDGTELSQVTPESTLGLDWSSRGQIAFAGSGEPCPPGCYDLYVTRPGGTPRRRTYREGYRPSWSPQGTKLAFVRNGDVYVMRRDGRGLRRLTHRGGNSPAWSPDGKWIAFVRKSDLYVVRTNGRGLRRLVNERGYEPDGPDVDSVDWQALPRSPRR